MHWLKVYIQVLYHLPYNLKSINFSKMFPSWYTFDIVLATSKFLKMISKCRFQPLIFFKKHTCFSLKELIRLCHVCYARLPCEIHCIKANTIVLLCMMSTGEVLGWQEETHPRNLVQACPTCERALLSA